MNTLHAGDSLKKRYLYKLSTNLVGLGIALVTQAIIPRGLGPKAYGDFHFLTGFFTNIQGFLDMGTSTCFFTKLSKRPYDSRLVSFYLLIAGCIALVLAAFVVGVHCSGINYRLWPDQKMTYVYMAAIFVILTWFSGIVIQMGDAYGITVATEKARLAQKALGFVLLLTLYLIHQLHLIQFFFYNYLIISILIGSCVLVISKKGLYWQQDRRLDKGLMKTYGSEFYNYSNPLFIAILAGNASSILDRWWLQVYSGSEQQGFYGFSYLIGAGYMLFANAMEPLIMREFAISYVKKDFERMASIFRRYIPSFYALAAFFSCFIAIQAEKVIYIMGGAKYVDARAVVTIMAFFPIHQSYGQLSSALIVATDQTALMRNISIAVSLIGVPVTYFLIAPVDKMGLNGGAAGLALKMVIMQFIGVNIQLYFNTRMLKLNFWRYITHQIAVVGCFLAIAMCATLLADFFFRTENRMIISFLASGVLYTLMVLGMVYLFPQAVGLNRNDTKSVIDMVRQKIG